MINFFAIIFNELLYVYLAKNGLQFWTDLIIYIYIYMCVYITKRMEKKLDGNYTRMLRAILNRSWRQHATKQQLYGHLPPITKTIQIWQTRHARHCWRSRDEVISDVLRWTPSYGQAKAGRPAQIYIQQLCEDTGCSSDDLLETMNYRERWRERVRDICADGMRRWWWWYPSKTNRICWALMEKQVQTHM